MKFSKKYSSIYFGVIMGTMMAFCMSIVLTLVNIGYSRFIQMWPRAFLVSFFISVPVSLLVAPFTKKIVERMTK